MSDQGERDRLLLPLLALHLLSRLVMAPALPQSWDAVGFVAAVDHYDLGAFQPHFPGYPIYVLLCRLFHLALPAVGACTTVSAVASTATAAALYRLAGWRAGAHAGRLALALYTAAFLPWQLGTAALSDATATAFAAIAFAGLTSGRRGLLVGAAALALMLGTRLSYWPLALSFALLVGRGRRSERLGALAAFTAALLAWLVPFLTIVGPKALVALGGVHLEGHFTRFGGSLLTETRPGLRLFSCLRDLLYDGVWPSRLALAAAALLVPFALRLPTRRELGAAATLALPYLAWVLLAQNVVAQPRHLLPLIAALLLGLARLAKRPWLGGLHAALALACALSPLVVWRRQPPPVVHLGETILAGEAHPGEALLFAGRSARLAEWALPTLRVATRDRLSEVPGALARTSPFPRQIYVTDELTGELPDGWQVTLRARACREPLLDRQAPCLSLLVYSFTRFP